MHDENTETLTASSLLQIHYDKRFIPAARAFVESTTEALCITAESQQQLVLLVEESLSFVMDKYIDYRFGAQIRLVLKLLPKDLVILEIADIGPPIHERSIPDFDILDPDSESGLWYTLVKKIADEISFENKYSDGWLISIKKHVGLTAPFTPASEESVGKNMPVLSASNHRIRKAEPDDVPNLIDLTYRTYRYSYDADFYNTELLRKAISSKIYDITLLEINDTMIGAFIIKYSESGDQPAEVGTAMVLPEYRTGRAVMLLFKAMNVDMEDNFRHCDFFVSHIVTTHIRSQKILSKTHYPFAPMFLYLNMVPRPNFIGIERYSQGRESLIWSYSMRHPPRLKTVFAPESKHALIGRILKNAGYEDDTVVTEAFAEPADSDSRITATQNQRQGFALLRLDHCGKDWFTALAGRIISLVAAGIESISVSIPAEKPLPVAMEEHLASLNLLFSGVTPTAADRMDLAYCLTTKPVDFDAIHLYGPTAQELLDAMRAEYSALHG